LEVARRAVELGGTISAEHGCGRKCFRDRSGRERPWLALLRSDAELDQVARVKHGFDPRHLLGRDVLLPAAELDARIAPETV
jgi:FAD/FMN-containing dehydrogenase